jgi:geranylgeranyl pyrophosphate synthase
MLRSRFAYQLFCCGKNQDEKLLLSACAATETIHTASLLHDDVIDQASLRRGQSTLWKLFSPNTAILCGDMLLCESLSLLLQNGSVDQVKIFVEKVKEVCQAETEQEIAMLGNRQSTESLIRIAREKTGPLFAFLGWICGGENKELAKALENVGYSVGTVYQLADDLIDITGEETCAGKTLGTDCLKNKFTLPSQQKDDLEELPRLIKSMIETSLHILSPWPDYKAGLENFYQFDIQPVLDANTSYLCNIMEGV